MANEPKQTTTKSPRPIDVNRKLTPPEAIAGALKVIEAVSRGKALTPQLVFQETGILLNQTTDTYHQFGHWFEENKDWGYVYVVNMNASDIAKTFIMDFTSPYPTDERPPMTSICAVDLKQVHSQLLTMGFEFAGTHRVAPLMNTYRIGENHISVSAHYQGESSEYPTHDCIHTLYLSIIEK